MSTSHLLGPAFVLVTFAISAYPFIGIDGDGIGLGVGAASILAMTWTFVLSVRFRWSEAIFGGLDRVYVAHRWLGVVAVVLMWWHVQSGNKMDSGGVSAASDSLSNLGTDLGGIAETWLYILVIASILRILPYRIWRWTHKLLGVPFAFASFHMITAEKPFGNVSLWGIWFLVIIAVGLGAYTWRTIGRDVIFRGLVYTVAAVVPRARSIELRLHPEGRHLRRRAGQFAFVKVQVHGASEPHPFSIASAPDDVELTFLVRELGDWTSSLRSTLRLGDKVRVEGPYGRLQVRPDTSRQIVWIAGGVGITPFLSAMAETCRTGSTPILLYAVRDRSEAHAYERIQEAAAAGKVEVHWFESSKRRRLTTEEMVACVGGRMKGAHVVLCGPADMIRWARRSARALGAHTIESEQFDIRGGIGPDPSLALMPRLRGR